MANTETTRYNFDDGEARWRWEALAMMVSPPPSDRVMDDALVAMIRAKLEEHPTPPSATLVWNTYKELLDSVVRYSWGSSFVISLLDLERFYTAPEGGYAQDDGSIDKAPWRVAIYGEPDNEGTEQKEETTR